MEEEKRGKLALTIAAVSSAQAIYHNCPTGCQCRRAAVGFLLLTLTGGEAVAAAPMVPSFRARRDYVPSVFFNTVAVADTNKDGIPDLIEISTPKVIVLLGNGKGGFRAGPTSDVACAGGPPVVADLSGDGIPDFAIPVGDGFCVSLANGDGTFQPAAFYSTGTDDGVTTVVVGDFNNDGVLDVATVGNEGIWLFTGNGGGALNAEVLTNSYTGAAVQYPNVGGAGDFNGDCSRDLVVETTTVLAVFFGNGNGTLV